MRYEFYVKNSCWEKPRALTGNLHRNEGITIAIMSRPLFPCNLEDVYIERTELTAAT